MMAFRLNITPYFTCIRNAIKMGVAQVNTSRNRRDKNIFLVVPDPIEQRISYDFYFFERLMLMVNRPNLHKNLENRSRELKQFTTPDQVAIHIKHKDREIIFASTYMAITHDIPPTQSIPLINYANNNKLPRGSHRSLQQLRPQLGQQRQHTHFH